MTSFEVSGTVRGVSAAVRWQDGELLGDEHALREISTLVADQEIIIEAIPAEIAAALKPGWVAQATILHAFDAGARLSGPQLDPPWFHDPPGRVY